MEEPDELKSCKESHSLGTKTCSVISQSYKPFISSKYTRRPLSTNAEFDNICITEPTNEALPISKTAVASSGFEQQLVIGLNFKHLKEHLADKVPLTTTSAVLIKEHSYPITTPVVFCSQIPIKTLIAILS